MEYGSQYDAALHVLLWELLSKLEKLLPVPDLKQVRTSRCLTSGKKHAPFTTNLIITAL